MTCVPELVEKIGTETGAVIVQTVLSALLGAVCGGASVIWEIDHWSLTKQSFLYFLFLAGVMLPIAYLTHWMEHRRKGVCIYIGVFVAAFLIIWVIL